MQGPTDENASIGYERAGGGRRVRGGSNTAPRKRQIVSEMPPPSSPEKLVRFSNPEVWKDPKIGILISGNLHVGFGYSNLGSQLSGSRILNM